MQHFSPVTAQGWNMQIHLILIQDCHLSPWRWLMKLVTERMLNYKHIVLAFFPCICDSRDTVRKCQQRCRDQDRHSDVFNTWPADALQTLNWKRTDVRQLEMTSLRWYGFFHHSQRKSQRQDCAEQLQGCSLEPPTDGNKMSLINCLIYFKKTTTEL